MHRLAARHDHVLERQLQQRSEVGERPLLVPGRRPDPQLTPRGGERIGEDEGALRRQPERRLVAAPAVVPRQEAARKLAARFDGLEVGLGDAVAGIGRSLSFKVYGARNPHLVEYDVPLEAALLFSVGPAGDLGPGGLGLGADGLPAEPPPLWDVRASEMARAQLAERYRETERQLQAGLDAGGGRFVLEGAVLWLLTAAGDWLPLKAKPDAVKEIQFAEGAGLNKDLVRQACQKGIGR